MRLAKIIAAVVVAPAVAATAAVATATLLTAPTVPPQPCAPEDTAAAWIDFTSEPCYWDAGMVGNGKGRSFWVNEDGTLTYLDGKP